MEYELTIDVTVDPVEAIRNGLAAAEIVTEDENGDDVLWTVGAIEYDDSHRGGGYRFSLMLSTNDATEENEVDPDNLVDCLSDQVLSEDLSMEVNEVVRG